MSKFCEEALPLREIPYRSPHSMHIADSRQIPSGIFVYTLPTRLALLTEGATDQERAILAQHRIYSQEFLARGTLVTVPAPAAAR